MKKLLLPGLLIISIVSFRSYSFAQQAKTTSATSSTPSNLEKAAQKKTQLLKDELFLSQDQQKDVLKINIDMLKKLDEINRQNLGKDEKKQKLTQLETVTKNKIVSLLTPNQRKKFESGLFTQVYQTRVDQKKAVSTTHRR